MLAGEPVGRRLLDLLETQGLTALWRALRPHAGARPWDLLERLREDPGIAPRVLALPWDDLPPEDALLAAGLAITVLAKQRDPVALPALEARLRAAAERCTHPVTATLVGLAESSLASARRREDLAEDRLRAVIASGTRAPLRRLLAGNLAVALASRGRLVTMPEDLRRPWPRGGGGRAMDLSTRGIDAVERGDLRASAVLDQLLGDGRSSPMRRFAAWYAALREIVVAVLAGRVADPSAVDRWRPRYDSEKASEMVRDVDLLLGLARGDATALRAAAALPEAAAWTGSGLVAATPVRARLLLGDVPGARRLIDLRRAHGVRHVGDGVLRARLHLAEGRRGPARDALGDAIAEARGLGAAGRLEFELRLAREVPTAQWLDLAWSGGGAPPERLDSTDRRQRLRDLLRARGRLTRAEAVRLLGVAKGTAGGDLQALVREGCAAKRMPTRAPRTHWFAWTGP